MLTRTKSQKPSEVTRKWYVIDASSQTLGRTSTAAARLLHGKHKTSYTPHVDGGDYVIVINADKLKVTGNKMDSKIYYRHSGYPGSTKSRTLSEQIERDATKVIEMSVRGMLPANKLRPAKLARLKVYLGADHEHTAQKPINFEVK